MGWLRKGNSGKWEYDQKEKHSFSLRESSIVLTAEAAGAGEGEDQGTMF